MKQTLLLLALISFGARSVAAAEITNVTLTVYRPPLADTSPPPENPDQVKSYWSAGLVVIAWTSESSEEKIDPASARVETNKNQLVLSYATKPVKWPNDVIPAYAESVRLEFVVRDITRTNYTITVKRR